MTRREVWSEIVESLDRLKDNLDDRKHVFPLDPREKIVGPNYHMRTRLPAAQKENQRFLMDFCNSFEF